MEKDQMKQCAIFFCEECADEHSKLFYIKKVSNIQKEKKHRCLSELLRVFCLFVFWFGFVCEYGFNLDFSGGEKVLSCH